MCYFTIPLDNRCPLVLDVRAKNVAYGLPPGGQHRERIDQRVFLADSMVHSLETEDPGSMLTRRRQWGQVAFCIGSAAEAVSPPQQSLSSDLTVCYPHLVVARASGMADLGPPYTLPQGSHLSNTFTSWSRCRCHTSHHICNLARPCTPTLHTPAASPTLGTVPHLRPFSAELPGKADLESTLGAL